MRLPWEVTLILQEEVSKDPTLASIQVSVSTKAVTVEAPGRPHGPGRSWSWDRSDERGGEIS